MAGGAGAAAAAGAEAAAAAPPPPLSTPLMKPVVVSAGRVKVKVNAVRFVASWKWDIPDEDVCGICHSEFERCCPSCKVPGDDCPPMWGACNHAFHMHCIMRWLEAPRSGDAECPMCRRPWEFRAE